MELLDCQKERTDVDQRYFGSVPETGLAVSSELSLVDFELSAFQLGPFNAARTFSGRNGTERSRH
jgi:hypothetical protein